MSASDRVTRRVRDLRPGDVVTLPPSGGGEHAGAAPRDLGGNFVVLCVSAEYRGPDSVGASTYVDVRLTRDPVASPWLADHEVRVMPDLERRRSRSSAPAPTLVATDPRVIAAASRLEELLPHLREVVNLVREGHARPYALLYEARRELGRVVATLGVGVPRPSGHDWSSDDVARRA